MRLQEVYGDHKALLAPGIVCNRRAMEEWMRPCEDLCWICETCKTALYRMKLVLLHENTRAFSIVSDRNFVIGAIYFLEDEMHGNAFDGNLLSKTKVAREAIKLIKAQYGKVTMNVPTDSGPIASWARKKLGFKDIGVMPGAWGGDLDVIKMEL